MNELSVTIPTIPPGKNRSHGYGRGKAKTGEPRVYVTNEAKKWSKDASLVIGAKLGVTGWKPIYKVYTLDILFSAKSKLDVDAPITLIQDVLSRKIAFMFPESKFDDKMIVRTTCEKIDGETGVALTLRGFD